MSNRADGGRSAALRALIANERPTTELVAELVGYGWDSEAELAVITRADVVRLLRALAVGERTEHELEEWANALEGRDDIGFESGFEGPLRQVLFEIANPALTERLTPTHAGELLSVLAE